MKKAPDINTGPFDIRLFKPPPVGNQSNRRRISVSRVDAANRVDGAGVIKNELPLWLIFAPCAETNNQI